MNQPSLSCALLLLTTACSGGVKDAQQGDDSGSGACPPETCDAGAQCLELSTPQDAATFTLQTTQITMDKPSALATGIVGGLVRSAATLDDSDCGLLGLGSWQLLMDFDTAAGTIRLGNGRGGSTPVNETIGGIAVAPVSANGTVDGGGAFEATVGDIVLAIALDLSNAEALVLPLREATLSGTLSEDRACVGSYNTGRLAEVDCVADSEHLAFTEAGELTGYILLEDADSVIVSSLQQSMCLLLTGNAQGYSDGASPARCIRDQFGQIVYQGDWCSASNSSASQTCADAVRLELTFAARAL